MSGLRAFAFLAAATYRNRVRLQLRRLRRPRHFVPLLAGVAYFGWVFFGQRGEGRAAIAAALGAPGVDALLALLIATRATTWWLFGSDRWSLAFSPAEIQFLFPAPIARRDLLQYRLLSAQVRVLFSVVVLAVVARRGPTTGASLLRALSLWTLLTTLHLHRLGASLARAGAVENGRVGLRRNIVPIALAGTGAAALGWAVVGAARSTRFVDEPFRALIAALDAPPAATALLPFRLVVRPLFAADPALWLAAIGPALLVLAFHYLWVVRSGIAFEDAAVEASAQLAARSAARRGGTGRQAAIVRRPRAGGWLPLAPRGAPLGALVWKNVVAAFRTLPLTGILAGLVAAVPVAAVIGALPPYARYARMLAAFALVWAGAVVVFGPQLVRTDLRQDLPRLALLRSYPLRGREVVLAQITASAVTLTALGAPALAAAYLASVHAPSFGGGLAARTALLVAALIVLPSVSALALSVQNATALLFPSWVRLGPTQRAGGIEASGQNMVVMFLSLAVLALLLLGPALVAGAVAWLLRPALGTWGFVPAAGSALAVAVAELWWIAGWLGGLFERTEPSDVGWG